MKVNIQLPNGTLADLEVGSGEASEASEAADLIRELGSQKGEKARHENAPSNLNAINYETWAYMVENDCENGIHYQALARGLGVTDKAAHNRIYRLAAAGAAINVGKGRYRAKG